MVIIIKSPALLHATLESHSMDHRPSRLRVAFSHKRRRREDISDKGEDKHKQIDTGTEQTPNGGLWTCTRVPARRKLQHFSRYHAYAIEQKHERLSYSPEESSGQELSEREIVGD